MNTLKILILASLCLFNLSCNRLFDINYSKNSKNSTIAPKTALLASWETSLPAYLKPAGGRMDVKVSLSDNDEAIMTWTDTSAAPDTSIYKSEYRDGSWQHPSSITDRINTKTTGMTLVVDLAFNKSGDAVLLWIEDGTDIYQWHYRNGKWESKELITSNGSLSIPRVKINDAGHAVISWADSTGLFVSKFNGTSWSVATELKAGDNSSFTGIADVFLDIAGSGDAILGFLKDVGAERLVYRAHLVGAVWSTPADVTDTLTTSGRDSRQLVVASSPSGRAIFYWLESDLSGEDLLYTQIYDGSSWGAKELLASDPTLNLDVGKVSISDLGQVAVSYLSQQTLSAILKFYNGSTWSSAVDSGDPEVYFLTAQNNQAEVFFLTAAEAVVSKTCSASGCNTGNVVIARDGGNPAMYTFVQPLMVKNSQRTIYIWYYSNDSTTRGLEVYSGTDYLIEPIAQ